MLVNWSLITSPLFMQLTREPDKEERLLTQFLLNYAPWIRTGDTYCHKPDQMSAYKCLYYMYPRNKGAIVDLGVAQFQAMFNDRHERLEDRFLFRLMSEKDRPAECCPPLAWLQQLSSPAPTNDAARWRWRCYDTHDMQVPVHKGMGVTYYNGRDSSPLIVTEYHPKLKGITVAPVEYRRIGGSGQSETQEYEFGSTPVGNQSWYITPSRRKADIDNRRVWRFAGGFGYYIVGYMDAYRDPSF